MSNTNIHIPREHGSRRTWGRTALSRKLPRFRCGFPLPEISGNFPHLRERNVLLKAAVEEGSCQSRGNVPFLYEEALICFFPRQTSRLKQPQLKTRQVRSGLGQATQALPHLSHFGMIVTCATCGSVNSHESGSFCVVRAVFVGQ